MKVTALLLDDLVQEGQKLSGGRNITESLLIALEDYISRQRLKRSMQQLKKNPLQFAENFIAKNARSKNQGL